MTIGIFGGSFNPIHKGHIAVARQAIEQTDIEEVWFVVSPHNPLKKHEELLDDRLRLSMVREALREEQGMVCSDYEFHLPRPSYMWNTLQRLSSDYPCHKFVLIIGADNWTDFSRWRNGEEIVSHHEIVIYPRRDYEIDAQSLPEGVSLLDVPLCDISSTEIRRRIAKGESVRDLTAGSVINMMADGE